MSQAVRPDIPGEPRSLADPALLDLRRALLARPRMRPLVALSEAIRAEHGMAPDADPLDGGADARLLLLLETPGPGIARTGLVSRDNPNGTAVNLFHFLAGANIPRADTLIWNAIPWVIHAPGASNRAPRAAEVAAARQWLPRLLDVLPRLAVVVLSGRVAGTVTSGLAESRPDLVVLSMPHPSPTYVCTSPDVARLIAATLDHTRMVLSSPHLTVAERLTPANPARAEDVPRSWARSRPRSV